MVKRIAVFWVLTIFVVSAGTMGQPTYLHPITSPCFNPMRNLGSGFPLGTDFLVFHPICMMAKELADADRLLKVGKRLAHDDLRAFSYEPSLQARLQRLLAALNKFSERVEQMKHQATQACPPWYLRW